MSTLCDRRYIALYNPVECVKVIIDVESRVFGAWPDVLICSICIIARY